MLLKLIPVDEKKWFVVTRITREQKKTKAEPQKVGHVFFKHKKYVAVAYVDESTQTRKFKSKTKALLFVNKTHNKPLTFVI